MSIPASAPAGRVITLGMFIIDQFEFRDPSSGALLPNHHPEQIGGGGTYAMVGARTFLPASRVGMVVDVGTDFPAPMRAALESYGDAMFWFRPRADGAPTTTRALNIYSGEERGSGYQSFQYLTPRCRISPAQLPASPFVSDAPPAFLHFVCGAPRAEEVLAELRTLGWSSTGLVWEPMPPDCTPANKPAIRAVSAHMAVVSPNHLEALALLSTTPSTSPPELRTQIEQATREIAGWLEEGSTAVVRSGADGVCFARGGGGAVEGEWKREVGWLPALFGAEEQDRVRDVTGGGNAFLGGVCAGLLLTGGDAYKALLYGSVAASFAIEQSGLPVLTPAADGSGPDIWSASETGAERLARFEQVVARLSSPPPVRA